MRTYEGLTHLEISRSSLYYKLRGAKGLDAARPFPCRAAGVASLYFMGKVYTLPIPYTPYIDRTHEFLDYQIQYMQTLSQHLNSHSSLSTPCTRCTSRAVRSHRGSKLRKPPKVKPQCSNHGTFAQALASSSHLGEYPTRPGTVARKRRRPGEGRATRARHKPKKADGGSKGRT
jgi:hypothetical protein